MKSFTKKTRDLMDGNPFFRAELKEELKLLIIVTLGFTIAFTWRQTIFDTVQTTLTILTHIENSTTLSVLASTAITLLSIVVILITSRFLRSDPIYR